MKASIISTARKMTTELKTYNFVRRITAKEQFIAVAIAGVTI